MLAFLAINALAWFFPSVAVCYPVSAYWSTKQDPTRCIDYNTFGAWISLPHIVSDLLIMALPLPVLLRMQMALAKKLGLVFTFFTGSM